MVQNPFQALPDALEVGGTMVNIDPDFRIGIAIELEATAEKPDMIGIIKQFYRGKIPAPAGQAVQQMIDFYAHQEEGAETKEKRKPVRSYDFAQDADAVLSSFMAAYQIDLSTARLHWWTFKRLLCNLPPETPFMRRIYYRTVDTKKMSKSERKHVEKMRRLYKLKAPERTGKSAEDLDREFMEKVRRRYAEAEKQVNG